MKSKDLNTVVGGGSGGVGLHTTRLLSESGANVVVLDLVPPLEIMNLCKYVKCDVSDKIGVKKAIDDIISNTSRIDALVNLAGTNVKDDYTKVINTNLTGAFNAMSAVHQIKKNSLNDAGERGVIINAGSITDYPDKRGREAYIASKAAVMASTALYAANFLEFSIRVNSITSTLFTIPQFGTTIDYISDLIGKCENGHEQFARLVKYIIETPIVNGMIFYLDSNTLWGGINA